MFFYACEIWPLVLREASTLRRPWASRGTCTTETEIKEKYIEHVSVSLYLADRASFTNSLFLFQLDTLLFAFFTITIFLYMFRTGWSIIRRIKCFITRAASGTVPSVIDVSCVAAGVRV